MHIILILFFRFSSHLLHPLLGKRNQFNTQKHKSLYPINFIIWLVLIPFKFIEIFGFSFLLNSIFKSFSKTRGLTHFEIQELKLVFKNSINYQNIRINENSKWAKIGSKFNKTKHLGFVWMQTINFTRTIDCENNRNDMLWLIHETVHVSQFNTLGIQYVFEALVAQNIGGYNYGEKLELQKNNALNYYNLEQQADMIKHYYVNLKLNNDLQIYNVVIDNLLKRKF